MHALPKLRIATAGAVGLLTALATFAAGPATSQSRTAMPDPATAADRSTLTAVVTTKLLDRADTLDGFTRAGPEGTVTRVTRRDGRWAFGHAILVAPPVEDAHAQTWLFLARRSGGSWEVAFDGERLFGQLSRTAPVLRPREQRLFISQQRAGAQRTNGDYRTGMQLPFAVGQSWELYGGPHGFGPAENHPFSSLDFRGGDQVVRAARGGMAYHPCNAVIKVFHNNGYRTSYYHLKNEISDGQWVAAGDRLGDTSTDTTGRCGGYAPERHVHFTLLDENGAEVAIAYHIIGKWIAIEGDAAYDGYALHGSRRADTGVGDRMHNYGMLGPTEGIVDANDLPDRKTFTSPSGDVEAGSVNDGETVSVSCSRNGKSRTGRWGTTALWNKLSNGEWLSDAYLYTGVDGPVSGWC